jgi:hypothetical protein
LIAGNTEQSNRRREALEHRERRAAEGWRFKIHLGLQDGHVSESAAAGIPEAIEKSAQERLWNDASDHDGLRIEQVRDYAESCLKVVRRLLQPAS